MSVCRSVCLSVCLSRWWTMLKLFNISKSKYVVCNTTDWTGVSSTLRTKFTVQSSNLWWIYKFGAFGDSGTIKMPGVPCFVLGAPNRLLGPTLISVTYYRKWIRVGCRVMFSALGPWTDLNQAFQWKFWHFGAPERFSVGLRGPRNGVPELPVRSGLLSPLVRVLSPNHWARL